MTQIASELGVKRPTLLYHFPTRTAIVEAALADLLAEQAAYVIERIEAEAHPVDQLYAWLRATHAFHDGGEARVLFLTQMVAAAGSARTRAIIEIGNVAFEGRRRQMAQRLRAGIDAGSVAPCDVDSLIRIIRGFNDGLIVQRMMTGCDLAPIHRFIWDHVLSPLKRS